MAEKNQDDIHKVLQSLSSEIGESDKPVAIILAAGHGKRIKSERSKMLHEIWGVPTVVRVAEAAAKGLNSNNQIIVVGIKAKQVAESAAQSPNRVFVFQKEQLGTGDATQVGLSILNNRENVGNIYIFPGDMGLLNADVVRQLMTEFEDSDSDMMVLTGTYKGDPEENVYGRIIRVPECDIDGNSSPDHNKVIEIKEHKDILAIPEKSGYNIKHNGREYHFSRQELLDIDEYNAGVYAVKYEPLRSFISQISPDNVQSEFYLTDIVSLFIKNNLRVGATRAQDNTSVIGFNVKSVLHEMECIAREKVWKKIRDIVFIEDENEFFIADEVVEQILEFDEKYPSVDIFIGRGVQLHRGVQINRGVTIKAYSILSGNVIMGENSIIEENVWLSTYPHQKIEIGNNCVIMRGDIVKGSIIIGENSRVESGVIITGSDEFPSIIGKNVIIKGTTYIFGSIVEDDLFIEHSVLKCKRVHRIKKPDGSIQAVRWVLPQPQGLDVVEGLD